jgi:hypothetical protein
VQFPGLFHDEEARVRTVRPDERVVADDAEAREAFRAELFGDERVPRDEAHPVRSDVERRVRVVVQLLDP